MSGAYVAKPAADVPPVPPEWPDPPPGWDENWPPPGTPGLDPDPFFPAPFPPGYTPDYSMIVTATAEIAPSGTASVTGSLRDHDTYATNEPDDITWTATIDGEAVQLRFSEGEFTSSISSSTSFSTYWGAAPSIEFDLTSGNIGDTVILTGASAIGGVAVTETTEVTIIAISMSFSLSMEDRGANSGFSSWLFRAIIDNQPEGSQLGASDITWNTGGGFETDETEEGGMVCTQSTSPIVITISADQLESGTFEVWYHVGTWRHDATFSLRITVNGILYTKTVVQDAGMGLLDEQLTWLTFDGATGEVTLINP